MLAIGNLSIKFLYFGKDCKSNQHLMHLYLKSVEQLVFVQIVGLSEVNQVPTPLIYPCPEAQFVSITNNIL